MLSDEYKLYLLGFIKESGEGNQLTGKAELMVLSYLRTEWQKRRRSSLTNPLQMVLSTSPRGTRRMLTDAWDAPGFGEMPRACSRPWGRCQRLQGGCSRTLGLLWVPQGCSDDARGHGEDAKGNEGDAHGCAGCCGLRGDAQGCSEDAGGHGEGAGIPRGGLPGEGGRGLPGRSRGAPPDGAINRRGAGVGQPSLGCPGPGTALPAPCPAPWPGDSCRGAPGGPWCCWG